MLETIVAIGDRFLPFITPDNAGFWITTGGWLTGTGLLFLTAILWTRFQTKGEK